MEALAMDLRTRVVRAYDRGEGTQIELAERFEVSERWIQKLLRQRRQRGSIEPLPRNSGRKPKVAGATLDLLKEVLAQRPDASLEELREACGVQGSSMCILRALQRLGITRKKRP
jgi:transposase